MRAVDIIRRKRDGGTLEPAHIAHFVRGTLDGSWPDYQISALLMAIVLRGMTPDETAGLTDAMARSGASLARAGRGPRLDKHSTGGVGDKISLVLAPLVAACGGVVPMMSGRALGHTGGTLDKLEAIPGYRTRLAPPEIDRVLDEAGCCIFGQTDDIAPADRRLYALRDVTGTVESVPLITASIMSKKLAEGLDGLVLDVKAGRGAFMRTPRAAGELADSLVAAGRAHGLAVEALVTAMDAPLGRAVGNGVEVAEAIDVLEGRGPADVQTLSIELAAELLHLGRLAPDRAAAAGRARAALASGEARERFLRMVVAQGGDPRVVDDRSRLVRPRPAHVVRAGASGYVAAIDAAVVGRTAALLGAGRARAGDAVDPFAGLRLHVSVGDPVERGAPLADLHGDTDAPVADAARDVSAAIALAGEPPAPVSLVLARAGAPPA
jgi:pyrimidine-nucleoside phosphorylase